MSQKTELETEQTLVEKLVAWRIQYLLKIYVLSGAHRGFFNERGTTPRLGLKAALEKLGGGGPVPPGPRKCHANSWKGQGADILLDWALSEK